jgi:branched-chain amino acid aminotransferase
MSQPLAFFNGAFIDPQNMKIPVTDLGFVQGVTVAEQLRTFAGKLFRIEQHLQRLQNSLNIIGVNIPYTVTELRDIAEKLASHNRALLASNDDLGLSMFVTPGTYGTFSAATGMAGPTIGMHTYPLPFHNWRDKYSTGDALVTTTIEQVPTACWPVELKCRSRMHYFLADKAAREQDPAARALILDAAGFVNEASTANVLIYRAAEGLISPPKAKILPGVTVAAIAELAAELKIPFVYRDITVSEVATANEVLLCSTSPCVWGVTSFNQQPIGNGQPGPIVQQLQQAWSRMVGVDIVHQAQTINR